MTRLFDFVTFDCYGTLIDWESGIGQALESGAAHEGLAVSAASAFQAYLEAERAVESEAYRPYRDVLAETAVRAARSLGWTLRREGVRTFVESLATWRPFPDTKAALARIAAAGVSLGILSNVDDDLLAETRRQFTVEFDIVVTAQQVRSYKPSHGHFLSARDRIGVAPWLHAAQSYFHDIVPAKALGISSAWINRHREKAGRQGPADREFCDLAGLAAWIESGSGRGSSVEG